MHKVDWQLYMSLYIYIQCELLSFSFYDAPAHACNTCMTILVSACFPHAWLHACIQLLLHCYNLYSNMDDIGIQQKKQHGIHGRHAFEKLTHKLHLISGCSPFSALWILTQTILSKD